MNIREQFPIFQHFRHINSCSHGALSLGVRKAYENYLDDRDRYGAPWGYWVEQLEEARSLIADLLNSPVDRIAVTSSVSAAVNGIAGTIDFSGERNRIVATDFDFPSTAQIWHAQESRGAEVIHVKQSPDGNTIPFENFIDAIDERTKLVSIPHVCYRNGAKLDVKPIIDLAHSRGAMVLLDSYQAVGTCAIDAVALAPDFLVGGLQKYLLGSSGTGFMYVKEDQSSAKTPTSSGWFAQADVHAMNIYTNEPALDARRFEAGTPNIPNLYSAIAGIKLIQSIGLDTIEAHIRELTGALKEGVLQRGFKISTHLDADKHGAMIAIKSTNMDKLVAALMSENIGTSCRDGNLRVSPHIYNNMEDIEYLLNTMTKYKDLLI